MASAEIDWLIIPGEAALLPKVDKLLPTPELPLGLKEIDSVDFWGHFFEPPSRISHPLFRSLDAEVTKARDQLPDFDLVHQAWQVYQDSNQGEYLHPLILVIGALGSGKTSLAESLVEARPNTTIFEEITQEEWEFIKPILDKFYGLLKSHFKEKLVGKMLEEMHDLQDSLQTWFANSRFTKILKAIIKSQDGPVAFDSSDKSDIVYEYVQERLRLVREEDFSRYIRTMQMRFSCIPPTRNITYVHNGLYSAETLRRRNKERGRDIEEGMPEGYLALLLDTCSQMTRALMKSGAQVILVDSEVINFAEDNKERAVPAEMLWQEVSDKNPIRRDRELK